MSLQGVFEWLADQIQYALFIILLVLLIVTAFKRAWIAMLGVIVGLAAIAMFIINPELIITIAEWLTGLLNFGGN